MIDFSSTQIWGP